MKKRNDTGFTLIELSIVLVVVGLIIGSILVALSILQNARVTSTINLLQSVQSAFSTYNQNYNAVAGDDKQAATRFASAGVTNSGGGDGLVGTASSYDGTATAADGNGAYESAMVWADLRAAGLVKGSATDVKPPSNPFGGVIGIQNGAFATNGIATGNNVMCISNVPGDAAKIIDQRQDDGDATTGNIRGGASISGDAGAYSSGNAYILCTKI